MDPVLLTTFGTLIVLLIFTVPIGVSIGTAVFMGMMVGGLPPVFLAQKMYSALDSFPLLAVPFFIVAGDIMQKGTIANSLLPFPAVWSATSRGAWPTSPSSPASSTAR